MASTTTSSLLRGRWSLGAPHHPHSPVHPGLVAELDARRGRWRPLTPHWPDCCRRPQELLRLGGDSTSKRRLGGRRGDQRVRRGPTTGLRSKTACVDGLATADPHPAVLDSQHPAAVQPDRIWRSADGWRTRRSAVGRVVTRWTTSTSRRAGAARSGRRPRHPAPNHVRRRELRSDDHPRTGAPRRPAWAR